MASNYKPSVGVQGGLYPLGEFPIATVADIEYPINNEPVLENGYYVLQPDTFYLFGTVDALRVSCVDPADGRLHEFAFEFTPSEAFTNIEFLGTPPSWANALRIAPGKAIQVSIVRGIGVSASVL